MRWLAAGLLLGIPATGAAQPLAGRPSELADLEALQAAFEQLADTLRPSVVAIQTVRRALAVDGKSEASRSSEAHVTPSVGSGVIIRQDGRILTNQHVVEDAEEIRIILHDGTSHPARAVHGDPRSDLAVVVIEAEGLTAARLGDLARVRQGQWAFALGNPFGMAADGAMIMSQGIVSAVGRKLRLDPTDNRYYGNLIQTTAAINPGNSGGPLVNLYGEVIGIATAISTRSGANEGIGFAVPIESRTKAIIETLLRGETVEYGYLGAVVRDTGRSGRSVAHNGKGAVVDRIEPGSPADKALLRTEDILLEYDGQTVENADHLVRLVGATPAGRSVLVRYVRNGRTGQTSVTLMRRPAALEPKTVSPR